MQTVRQDIRECLRKLAKRPGLTAISLLMTGIGILAVARAIPSVEATILRNKTVRDAGQIVVIAARDSDGPASLSFSYPMRLEFQEMVVNQTGVTARYWSAVTEKMVCPGVTGQVRGELVSGNYFKVLGAQPWVGRLITEADEEEGMASPVAVISYGFWKRRFGMDPSIVGRTIVLNGYRFKVIGVTDPRFVGTDRLNKADIVVLMASMRALHPPVLRASRVDGKSKSSL